MAASLLYLSMTGAAMADESGSFVVKLGQDTVSLEQFTRTPTSLEVDQVGRSPRLMHRHLKYEYAGGALTRLSMVVTPPGAGAPTQTLNGAMDGDSLRLSVVNGAAPPSKSAIGVPAGSLVVAFSSPWSGYDGELMKFVQSGKDSVRTNMYFVGFPTANWLSLHRLGADSVVIWNEHQDLFHVRVDPSGRILGVLPIAGTGKFSVERVKGLDLAAMTASFAARDTGSTRMGMLSPRDTVRASLWGANIMVDYGRPGKRGRTIFPTVVPYGQVWRAGANAATQFKTDKALDFGGTVVPAGFYTLWAVPNPGGWKLLFNSQTGQWGTEHDAAKDVYSVDMKVSAQAQVAERFTISIDPAGMGGTLDFTWDTTRASAAFAVKP
jgi:hypothetical protein